VNETLAVATDPAAPDSGFPPGRYQVRLALDNVDDETTALPYELAVETLGPDERPGLVREPGPEPEPVATPAPSPAPGTDADESAEGGGSSDAPLLAGAAVGGLAVGLAASVLMRRRRRT
jgi:hypothetical protein